MTLSGRQGHREGIRENNARHRIDRLARSLVLEEEDAIGLPCFGPRIRDEPFPKGFLLPRDTPKYNGSMKPEDWLVDYSTAVNITNINKARCREVHLAHAPGHGLDMAEQPQALQR